MSIEQRLLLVLGLLLISGCAGYKAMVVERTAPQEPCGILVCEHWGIGRVKVPEDCVCSGAQSLPEIR